MKKLIILLSFSLLTSLASAQHISNGGFEHWHPDPNTVLVPDSFWVPSSIQNQNTVVKSVDAHSGNSSACVRIDCVSTGCWGGRLEYGSSGGYWSFTGHPDKLSFWYKFTNPDHEKIQVKCELLPGGSATWATIGYASNWTKVTIPFVYTSGTPQHISFSVEYMTDKVAPALFWIDDISLEYTTNVQMIEKGHIQILPNPTIHQFTIDVPAGRVCALQVPDLTGKLIHQSKNHQDKTTIDCSTWAKGMYLVQVRTEKEIYTEKLIIQ